MNVAENSANGTRVGQLIGSDADLGRDVVKDGLFREATDPAAMATYTAGNRLEIGPLSAVMWT